MSLQTIGNIPSSFSVEQQQFLQSLIAALKQLQPTVVRPKAPTSLKVIPTAGGNLITFIPGNGDTSTLYRNTTSSFDSATAIALGRATQYFDGLGPAGATIFYWIQSSFGSESSPAAGPVSGTSGASGGSTMATSVEIVENAGDLTSGLAGVWGSWAQLLAASAKPITRIRLAWEVSSQFTDNFHIELGYGPNPSEQPLAIDNGEMFTAASAISPRGVVDSAVSLPAGTRIVGRMKTDSVATKKVRTDLTVEEI